ncbi:hypothetical protein KFK09_027731 [Dendrobium nobile]|uniref:Uncharacterized protein n=1 Tax=Dendrobium nobile TaxID=94219 RepID=A0A8T3A0L5_DENNO|nr:hypothetical protein KFK09_027731 [Dendrobium nobile]
MESLGCSIEMEPRTLSGGKISNAREEAVEIFLNRDPEEASLIFSKGKKDGNTAGERKKERFPEVSIKRWRNASVNSTTSKGLDYVRNAREPLSSPF